MEQAQNALSQLLFRVRRELGPDSIVGTRELRLNPSAISCDCAEFVRAIADRRLEAAVELYRGPFLTGFYIREAPDFERWSGDERRRFDHDFIDALEKLAGGATANGNHAAAAAMVAAKSQRRPAQCSGSARGISRASWSSGIARLPVGSSTRTRRSFEVSSETNETSSSLLWSTEPSLTRRPRWQDTHEQIPVDPKLPRLHKPSAAIRLARRQSRSPYRESNRSSEYLTERPAWLGAHGLRTRWAITGGVVVAVAFLTTVAFARRVRSPETNKLDHARVLVATFTNRSGDTTLNVVGAMAADWITQGLSESEIVNVVDGPTSIQVSRATSRDSAASDTNRVRLLAERTGAGTVVLGTLLPRARLDRIHHADYQCARRHAVACHSANHGVESRSQAGSGGASRPHGWSTRHAGGTPTGEPLRSLEPSAEHRSLPGILARTGSV